MILRETSNLDQYARYLQTHPSEIGDLFEDILIPVTSFFREPETFQALQNDVFPKIAAGAPKSKSIRVWPAVNERVWARGFSDERREQQLRP
jgi:two-component system CheB/CheR fusion protein